MNRRLSSPAAASPGTSAQDKPAPARGIWRAWREQHADALRAGMQRPAHSAAAVLTLLVTSLVLALPPLLWLLLDNAHALGGRLDDARAISVFLKPGIDDAAAQTLAARLRTRADVADVAIRTPQQGLEEFRDESGFGEALKLLKDNPLPSVLIVTPRPGAPNGPAPLVAELERDAQVDQVQDDARWRARLEAILAFATRIGSVLTVLLGLAAALVIGNGVRVDIAARGEEIAVLQLLGAGNAFVRRPFLYGGLVYGVLGGLLALAVIFAVELALAEPLRALSASYDGRIMLHGLTAPQAGALLGVSGLLGWLGAWLAASWHLARGLPR